MRIGQKATIVESAGLGMPNVYHGKVSYVSKGTVWVTCPNGIQKRNSATVEIKKGHV
jgi:hypothetical protein